MILQTKLKKIQRRFPIKKIILQKIGKKEIQREIVFWRDDFPLKKINITKNKSKIIILQKIGNDFANKIKKKIKDDFLLKK